MPRFRVSVVESRDVLYEIDADSKEEAEEIAKEMTADESVSDQFRESYVDWSERLD